MQFAQNGNFVNGPSRNPHLTSHVRRRNRVFNGARANPAKVEIFGDKDLLQSTDLARILFGDMIPTPPEYALGPSSFRQMFGVH